MGSQSCPAVALALALGLAVAACGPTAPDGSDDVADPDGGGPLPDGGPRPDGGPFVDDCQTLRATIRDFSPSSHADFEPLSDSDFSYPGLVEAMLGSEGKPVYAPSGSTPHTAGPAEFAQWYRDTPGINMTFPVNLPLTAQSGGRYTYDSAAFFPLDAIGFGNEGQPHNFHFTTEIHTTFVYQGGEVFNFLGDDDLWLFINQRLAIDLGGLHPELPGSVDLDASAAALGITVGNTYRMDIFHAERHTDASNFHVETTIDCFVVP